MVSATRPGGGAAFERGRVEAGASPIVRGGERMADLLDNPHAVLDGQVRDRAA